MVEAEGFSFLLLDLLCETLVGILETMKLLAAGGERSILPVAKTGMMNCKHVTNPNKNLSHISEMGEFNFINLLGHWKSNDMFFYIFYAKMCHDFSDDPVCLYD